MLNYYKPSLVTLLETHMVDNTILRDDFGFTHLSEVPAEGHVGGIVVLWIDHLVTVHELAINTQEIHCMVQVHKQPYNFLFLKIYASPYLHNRKLLSKNLKQIAQNHSGPWLVGSDFNDILTASEKCGGNSLNNTRSDLMLKCFNYCQLVDLGFRGSRYTWTNK